MDTPWHAAALGHPPRHEDIEMMAGFFRNQPFARIGATVTLNTTLAGEFAPIDAIAGALKNRMHIGAGGTLLEIQAVTL